MSCGALGECYLSAVYLIEEAIDKKLVERNTAYLCNYSRNEVECGVGIYRLLTGLVNEGLGESLLEKVLSFVLGAVLNVNVKEAVLKACSVAHKVVKSYLLPRGAVDAVFLEFLSEYICKIVLGGKLSVIVKHTNCGNREEFSYRVGVLAGVAGIYGCVFNAVLSRNGDRIYGDLFILSDLNESLKCAVHFDIVHL